MAKETKPPSAPGSSRVVVAIEPVTIDGTVFPADFVLGTIVGGKPRPTPEAAAKGVTCGNLEGRLQAGVLAERDAVTVKSPSDASNAFKAGETAGK